MDDSPTTQAAAPEGVSEAIDALTRDYAARRNAEAGFDAERYFLDLRRMVEARVATLEAVRDLGPMGGGGPNEA